MAGFRSPEVPREQLVLWSHRLEEAIPVDHPVRHVDLLLKSGAFAKTFHEWERQYFLLEGQPPYHPRDLAGLYMYGMMNRLRSSRQLEAACFNRLDVIWLMSGQHPDHSTIAEFVKAHGGHLRKLFRDVLAVAVQAGLVKLEHVSVDGTKLEADAGKGSVHKQETIARMLEEVEQALAALEKEWSENESRESRLLGTEAPWSPPSSGTPAQRCSRLRRQRERLAEALASIERRRAENVSGPALKAIASVTDPSSRVMPDKEGKSKPNYNAQIAVDSAWGIVTGQEVNDRSEDSGQLTPMLEQVEEHLGNLPKEVSADSGYNTGSELASLEELGITGFLPDSGQRSAADKPETPATAALAAAQSAEALTDEQWAALPKDGKGRITKDAFGYDPEANVYRCPMGQVLPFLQKRQDPKRWGTAERMQYGGCPACAHCPRAAMCCSDSSKGRIVSRDQYEGHRERMRQRMKTPQGRSRYRLRGPTVEPPFGHIKRGLGIRRFLRRGLEAVRTEWSMICTVVNVGILHRHWAEVAKVL